MDSTDIRTDGRTDGRAAARKRLQSTMIATRRMRTSRVFIVDGEASEFVGTIDVMTSTKTGNGAQFCGRCRACPVMSLMRFRDRSFRLSTWSCSSCLNVLTRVQLNSKNIFQTAVSASNLRPRTLYCSLSFFNFHSFSAN